MSIFINKDTKVITQGITGKTGQFHTEKCQEYANGKNCFVAGVNPKKAGESIFNIPIYASVKEAASNTGATVSVIYVPPAGAADAIWEAVMAWVAERLMSKMEAAAAGSTTHLAALEAMFMSHVDFVIEHPGVPRMMFGEMQRAEPTAAKRMAQTLMQRYGEMLCQRLKQGQDEGEIAVDINVQAAATLFIGSIQGLVMQSMLSGDISKIRQAAPGVFAIYLRGISCITNIASIKGAR